MSPAVQRLRWRDRHQNEVSQTKCAGGEGASNVRRLVFEPVSRCGADHAQAPAVVQLERVTVANRKTSLLLQYARLGPALGVHSHPVGGLARKVRGVNGFGSCGAYSATKSRVCCRHHVVSPAALGPSTATITTSLWSLSPPGRVYHLGRLNSDISGIVNTHMLRTRICVSGSGYRSAGSEPAAMGVWFALSVGWGCGSVSSVPLETPISRSMRVNTAATRRLPTSARNPG
jgi:hypothetical protein